ncbi:MAG: hypothetical protein NTU88_08095 [Armatimonadetes bacterium]|nr:hypothetical protein [Armatimonadota bacterium]
MDRTGRFIGMAVFLLGVVVLLVVFGMAYGMFTTPASRLFSGNGGHRDVRSGKRTRRGMNRDTQDEQEERPAIPSVIPS